MIVDTDRRFIFYHAPKTGGTTCQEYLSRWCNDYSTKIVADFVFTKVKLHKHMPPVEIAQLLPPILLKRCFKCVIARNPWDRAVSFYYHVHTHRGIELPEDHVKDFKKWVVASFTTDIDIQPRDIRLYRQEFYSPPDLVDYVGKWEELHDSMYYICRYSGIPFYPDEIKQLRVGKPRQHKDYRLYYDTKTAEIIANLGKTEIDMFRYTF